MPFKLYKYEKQRAEKQLQIKKVKQTDTKKFKPKKGKHDVTIKIGFNRIGRRIPGSFEKLVDPTEF